MKSVPNMEYVSFFYKNVRSGERDYGAIFANIEYATEEYETRKKLFQSKYLKDTDRIFSVEEFENYGFLEYMVTDENGTIIFQLKVELCSQIS